MVLQNAIKNGLNTKIKQVFCKFESRVDRLGHLPTRVLQKPYSWYILLAWNLQYKGTGCLMKVNPSSDPKVRGLESGRARMVFHTWNKNYHENELITVAACVVG